jgi:hypothetical protein
MLTCRYAPTVRQGRASSPRAAERPAGQAGCGCRGVGLGEGAGAVESAEKLCTPRSCARRELDRMVVGPRGLRLVRIRYATDRSRGCTQVVAQERWAWPGADVSEGNGFRRSGNGFRRSAGWAAGRERRGGATDYALRGDMGRDSGAGTVWARETRKGRANRASFETHAQTPVPSSAQTRDTGGGRSRGARGPSFENTSRSNQELKLERGPSGRVTRQTNTSDSRAAPGGLRSLHATRQPQPRADRSDRDYLLISDLSKSP